MAKKKVTDQVNITDNVEVKSDVTSNGGGNQSIETLTKKIEEMSKIAEELQRRIEKAEKLIKKFSTTSKGKNKKDLKPYKLNFKGKKVLVTTISNSTSFTTVPIDSITMTPTNTYRFELDDEYDTVKIADGFDDILELVNTNGRYVKVRPRTNVVLKNGSIVFLVG